MMRKFRTLNLAGIRSFVMLLALTGLLLGWSATPASAQDDDVSVADDSVEAAWLIPGTNAVVADGPLNQRSSASLGGTVLQVLATGTIVSVISGPTSANGYSWYYVTANSIDGYVAGRYLASVGFVIGDAVFVDANYVNIRSGPGTGYSIIDQLSYGATGEVIAGPSSANGYTWYKIQYRTSATGWIAGLYLTLSSAPPSGGFGVGSWILVDDPPVNLRSGPGTGYSILESLQNNQALQVTGVPTSAGGYAWYPVIRLSGPSGYVAGAYFRGGIFQEDYATVVDGPLNLRASASTSGTIRTTMPTGASVYVEYAAPVYSGGQTWFSVTYNGITGWAAGAYLGPA